MSTLAYLWRDGVTDERESSFRALSSTLLLIGQKWKLVKLVYSGCFLLCQNFRKFRSKRKWNGSDKAEIFRSKWSTSRGGPLWPDGPARPKIDVHFQKFSFAVPLLLVTPVKMAGGLDVSVYECGACKLHTQDVNFLLMRSCTQGSGTAVHLTLFFLLVFISF